MPDLPRKLRRERAVRANRYEDQLGEPGGERPLFALPGLRFEVVQALRFAEA